MRRAWSPAGQGRACRPHSLSAHMQQQLQTYALHRPAPAAPPTVRALPCTHLQHHRLQPHALHLWQAEGPEGVKLLWGVPAGPARPAMGGGGQARGVHSRCMGGGGGWANAGGRVCPQGGAPRCEATRAAWVARCRRRPRPGPHPGRVREHLPAWAPTCMREHGPSPLTHMRKHSPSFTCGSMSPLPHLRKHFLTCGSGVPHSHAGARAQSPLTCGSTCPGPYALRGPCAAPRRPC